MRLKAGPVTTMHISGVKADSIRPGEQFTVSDAAGEALLKAHPGKFEKLDGGDAAEEKSEAKPKNKVEPPHPDKAETPPISNKRK